MSFSRKEFLTSLAKERSIWYRVGGGHYFEFEAPDELIAARLEQDLLPEYGPYRLVAAFGPSADSQAFGRRTQCKRF